MSSELERTVDYLKESVVAHRKAIFWIFTLALLMVLMVEVREVVVLLLAAYGISLLLDPIVTWMERRGIPRSLAIIAIGAAIVLTVRGLVILAVPDLIDQYQELVHRLPDYLKASADRINFWLQRFLRISGPHNLNELAEQAHERLSAIGVNQLKGFLTTVGGTLLSGYSLALTIINLFLLPFFVFYLTRDFRLLHRFLASFLNREHRWTVRTLCLEIMTHVYAFFRGQLTVCVILACMYSISLSIAGLPSAVLVGTLSGLLNIVPYLGVGIGLLLSTIITLVTDPSLTQFAMVYAAFAVVNLIEGTLITPKIVGESVGIHPLGVMVALIIGGQLLGLLGLIIAIPAAAAVRVLFRHLHAVLDEMPEPGAPPVADGFNALPD